MVNFDGSLAKPRWMDEYSLKQKYQMLIWLISFAKEAPGIQIVEHNVFYTLDINTYIWFDRIEPGQAKWLNRHMFEFFMCWKHKCDSDKQVLWHRVVKKMADRISNPIRSRRSLAFVMAIFLVVSVSRRSNRTHLEIRYLQVNSTVIRH